MRRTAAMAALSLLLLGAAIGLPVAGILWHREAERDLSAARLARRDLDSAFVAALNALAAVHSYVLTADAASLQAHENAVEDAASSLDELRQNVRDDQAHEQVDAFEQSFNTWHSEAAARQVELVGAGNLLAAQRIVTQGPARELFSEVARNQEVLGGILAAEETTAREDLNSARGDAAALFVAGLLCAAGVGVTMGYLLRQYRRYERELATTRANLELAEHLSVTRGEMLSAASHELRNPLTGLLLAAEVLAEEARRTDGDGLAELADDISVAARRTGQMVSELLDFTRIEAGQLQIDHAALAPRQVVEEAIEDVRLGKPGAAFDVDVDIAIPPGLQIEGDFLRLRMAVRNLLENALRYGRPPYRVRLDSDAGEVIIHVEDAGPGVPAAERAGIFERFQRGSTAEGTAGTGIGLFLAQGIVALHGGRLDVGQSDLGGADFVVRLPVRQPVAG